MSGSRKTVWDELVQQFPAVADNTEALQALWAIAPPRLENSIKQHYTHSAPAARAQAAARMLELVLNGAPVPDDIAQPILDAEEHDRMLHRRVALAYDVTGGLLDQSTEARRASVPGGLEYLHDRLVALVERALEVIPNLRGARSAKQAIAIDDASVAAWRVIGDLARTYGEIRDAQFRLVSAADVELVEASEKTASTLSRSGWFADAIEVHPHWQEARSRAGQNSTGESPFIDWLRIGGDLRSQWSDAEVDRLFQARTPTIDPELSLLWLVENSTPWVPSIDTMRDASETATRACTYVSAQHDPDAQTQLAALAAYCSLTKADWPHGLPRPAEREPATDRRMSMDEKRARGRAALRER